jgi:4-hydroxybenzoate polyprenyltransferase
MKKLRGYLQLMRPANLVTAIADVLAGIAVASFFDSISFFNVNPFSVVCICISTLGLYGGGVVFNDVFDAELDSVERPERPLPQKIVPINYAITLGIVLLIIGISAAFLSSLITGILSVSIAILALVYDKWSKHISILGPINMGACRSLNLMLGLSIFPAALTHFWYLGLIPLIYIASITLISSDEVRGGNRSNLYTATFFYIVVITIIFLFIQKTGSKYSSFILLALFCIIIGSTLFKAINNPAAKNIRTAVKAGILSLIIINSTLAAAVGQLPVALIIVSLLPISFGLGKLFAVT